MFQLRRHVYLQHVLDGLADEPDVHDVEIDKAGRWRPAGQPDAPWRDVLQQAQVTEERAR